MQLIKKFNSCHSHLHTAVSVSQAFSALNRYATCVSPWSQNTSTPHSKTQTRSTVVPASSRLCHWSNLKLKRLVDASYGGPSGEQSQAGRWNWPVQRKLQRPDGCVKKLKCLQMRSSAEEMVSLSLQFYICLHQHGVQCYSRSSSHAQQRPSWRLNTNINGPATMRNSCLLLRA